MSATEATGRKLAPHGSWGAYKRHKRAGEEPCAACLVARDDHNAEQYRKRTEGKVSRRNKPRNPGERG